MEWTLEQAIRSEGIAIVIADGTGLSMAGSRRLQLAMASRVTPQVVLLARPWSEVRQLSASLTRWVVTSASGTAWPPRWRIRLARCRSSLFGSLATSARNALASRAIDEIDRDDEHSSRHDPLTIDATPQWECGCPSASASASPRHRSEGMTP
jgi:hypothetical protein